METLNSLTAAYGSLVPELAIVPRLCRAVPVELMATWSPSGICPRARHCLTAIWFAGRCRPHLAITSSGLRSLQALACASGPRAIAAGSYGAPTRQALLGLAGQGRRGRCTDSSGRNASALQKSRRDPVTRSIRIPFSGLSSPAKSIIVYGHSSASTYIVFSVKNWSTLVYVGHSVGLHCKMRNL